MNDASEQLMLPPPEPEKTSRWTLRRILYIVVGVVIGLILLIFVIGLVLALFTDAEQTAARVQIIRDIFLIILALQGILIVIALAVLILQIARLVNLLQNEIMPILRNTQDTVNTAKGTVEFVGKNVAEPVLAFNGFMAGLGVLFRELFGIRRALKREDTDGRDAK